MPHTHGQRFPAQALAQAASPFWTTLIAGLAAALVALALVLGCLEHESRARLSVGRRALAVLYLPLLVPQVAFLFGLQVLLLLGRLEGSWAALVLAHLVFVLPYVYLSLSEPFRAVDRRLVASAEVLGHAVGRETTAAVGVVDRHLARGIQDVIATASLGWPSGGVSHADT